MIEIWSIESMRLSRNVGVAVAAEWPVLRAVPPGRAAMVLLPSAPLSKEDAAATVAPLHESEAVAQEIEAKLAASILTPRQRETAALAVELPDLPVQFGENNWAPHQRSFDGDAELEPEPAPPSEGPAPVPGLSGHRSWREWYRANEAQVAPILAPRSVKQPASTDTAEFKLLKEKFRALVYGRNKGQVEMLFRKIDPNGMPLSLPLLSPSRSLALSLSRSLALALSFHTRTQTQGMVW